MMMMTMYRPSIIMMTMQRLCSTKNWLLRAGLMVMIHRHTIIRMIMIMEQRMRFRTLILRKKHRFRM